MSECNGVQTPHDMNQDLFDMQVTENDAPKVDVPHQEAIGFLMNLAQRTRPDIAFTISFMSRFNGSH